MHPFVKRWIVGDLTLRRFLRSVLLIYGGLLVWAYFFGDRIIFPAPPASYTDTSEIIKVTTSDGRKISAIYLPSTNSPYVILHSHGNFEDLGSVRSFLDTLNDWGFGVFAYDYEGYGTSQGRPTEAATYCDVEAAYDYLVNDLHVPPEHIISHGRSVGAALAIDLASRKPVGGLVIESAFVTAFRVKTVIPIAPFDKFRNIDKIARVKCPVLIFHGKDDDLIPIWHGEKLFAAAPEPKRAIWVDKAGHNDLFWVCEYDYEQAMLKFAADLAVKKER